MTTSPCFGGVYEIRSHVKRQIDRWVSQNKRDEAHATHQSAMNYLQTKFAEIKELSRSCESVHPASVRIYSALMTLLLDSLSHLQPEYGFGKELLFEIHRALYVNPRNRHLTDFHSTVCRGMFPLSEHRSFHKYKGRPLHLQGLPHLSRAVAKARRLGHSSRQFEKHKRTHWHHSRAEGTRVGVDIAPTSGLFHSFPHSLGLLHETCHILRRLDPRTPMDTEEARKLSLQSI